MSQALNGLKVLDLTMNLPGPYMTWLLALLGAEVVKLENPAGGDYARALGGKQNSPFFEAVNRNKKSVALNLKHADGKRLFLELLDHYDIMVEGFRPGTMEKLGLGYDTTSARNARLIHVSITGYGHDGPYRLRAGHDINYLSLAGVIGMTGTADGRPGIPGVQVADLAGGSLMGIAGLLAAVIQREKTGQGQFVDVSMFHGSFSLATMVFAGVESGLEQPEPGKMLLNGRFPCYGLYKTADDLWMSVGALEFKFWENFCNALDRKDLVASQFGGPEVVDELRRLFASRTQTEWVEVFKNADACCEPVLSLADASNSTLVATRQMINRNREGGRALGFPLILGHSPVPDDIPAPALGEHTREILEQLGLGPDEIESLARQGTI
ncbi:MAG: CoA transferase [Desulfomonile tiedjei]|nr:CoA transferase [Desulfomonile tiedjei]